MKTGTQNQLLIYYKELTDLHTHQAHQTLPEQLCLVQDILTFAPCRYLPLIYAVTTAKKKCTPSQASPALSARSTSSSFEDRKLCRDWKHHAPTSRVRSASPPGPTSPMPTHCSAKVSFMACKRFLSNPWTVLMVSPRDLLLVEKNVLGRQPFQFRQQTQEMARRDKQFVMGFIAMVAVEEGSGKENQRWIGIGSCGLDCHDPRSEYQARVNIETRDAQYRTAEYVVGEGGQEWGDYC